jgi:23S rRNA G2445 N2-methylase RlmL
MPTFLGLTSRGLNEPLASEIQEIKVKKVRSRPDAVEFEGSWADVYRVHLQSRLATRIFLPVADFQAYNEDDLYYGVSRKHDFTKYITPQQTLKVEAHVRDNKALRDQRFVAMKVKDAVVDQFWTKFNERPSVSFDNADLRLVVRVVGSKVSLAIDLTGDPLSHRGYRRFAGAAPLRENVAAGLLRLSGWQAPLPLVDPFCGSGTVLIEAALGLGAGSLNKRRRRYAFENLSIFQADKWASVNVPPIRKAAPSKPFLFGYDKDPVILQRARENARNAGVENWILFQQRDIRELKAPADRGVIITNPPYGERIGDVKGIAALYGDFAATLKREFKDWDAWILSGSTEASAGLRLKSVRKIPIWNGPIECRFLHYPLR